MDERLLHANLMPSETVRGFRSVFEACNSGQWDMSADPSWPLREVRKIQTYWVRSVLRRHSPIFEAPFDEVWTSGRTLFWEAVRRSLSDQRMRSATRLICKVVKAAEEASCAAEDTGNPLSHKIMSTDVEQLLDADLDALGSARAPFADEVAQVTWLPPEIMEIIGPNRGWVEERAHESFQAFEESFQHGSFEGASPEPTEPTEPPEIIAPSIQALESGNATTAEGIVFENYMQRGVELENERMSARMSYQTTLRLVEAPYGDGMSAWRVSQDAEREEERLRAGI